MKFADIGSPGANLAIGKGEYRRFSVVKGSRNRVCHQKKRRGISLYHKKYHAV